MKAKIIVMFYPFTITYVEQHRVSDSRLVSVAPFSRLSSAGTTMYTKQKLTMNRFFLHY